MNKDRLTIREYLMSYNRENHRYYIRGCEIFQNIRDLNFIFKLQFPNGSIWINQIYY